jgi:type III secretion protein C
MKIVKFSRCHQLLKIWLIAIACQTGPLFSQLEQDENYPYAISIPQDGQWPAYSKNEWQSSPDPQPYDAPSYFPSTSAINGPQDGQWPAYSKNEWQSSPDPQPYDTPSYFPSTINDFQIENAYPPTLMIAPPSDQSQINWAMPPDQMIDYPDNVPSDLELPFLDQTPPAYYSQPHSEFAPFPPPEHAGADKQNFITFDPLLEEAPDKEQHPLTKEGEATAYHFKSDSPAFQEHASNLDQKNKTTAENQESLSNEPELPPPSLSQGKSNIKIIKKRSEPIPPTRRLEEALNQPEGVIGKQVITEPLVGIEEDSDKLKSQPLHHRLDSTPSHLKEELAETIAHMPSSQTVSSSQITASPELIAQTAPTNRLEPPAPLDSSPVDQQPSDNLTAQTLPLHPALPAPAHPRPPTVITPNASDPSDISQAAASPPGQPRALKEISVNFNNVAMVEYIRFISRISNKNFIFEDQDLQFNVTIVSEEPTTVENLMAALLQELKIRDLSLMEQGNNIIIYRNPRVRAPARIVADGTELISSQASELVTRVFRLNTLDPVKASEIIRPLLSEDALIEVLRDTNNLIITDLVANVNKITQLINTLDAPNSGVTIGQYVVRNAFVDSLVDLANKILQPIAQGNPFVLVPHPVSNSIFVVSNSFIVEKALAILQNLDINEGRTKILSLETLQPVYPSPSPPSPTAPPTPYPIRPGGAPPTTGPGGVGPGGIGGLTPSGVGPGGFGPGGQFANPAAVPESFPLGGIGAEGAIPPVAPIPPPYPPPPSPFAPGGIGAEGWPSAIFDESRNFLPGGIEAATRWARELPVGHIERTLFFIHRLRYRRGDIIEIALRKIANSLQLMGTANADLISAINSIQWIEPSNALIFTGTAAALEKVRELILEIDVPLRQVFIEMLILNTTITDSLAFSVDWIDRFGGGTTTGEEGFIQPTGAASTVNFLNDAESIFPGTFNPIINPITTNEVGVANDPFIPVPALPIATGFLNSGGFAAGVIGTHLTHNGTRFNTIGALVRALHANSKLDIILNPKIITEDNNPAEIFVGGTDRYKTQSITNDLGVLVTNNFQFIDVGTTLRVTPLIGNNGIITLEIIQETTSPAPGANDPALALNQDVNLVQVLNKSRTITKVHVPNGFFVVLSGLIQDQEQRSYNRIPCLGGIPIIGAFGKQQANSDLKMNLMLFIRPLIIDTDDDYEDVTRRQQDVYREKTKFRRSWNYEIDEALNFGNIKSTDPDDMDCRCSDREHR